MRSGLNRKGNDTDDCNSNPSEPQNLSVSLTFEETAKANQIKWKPLQAVPFVL